MTVPTPVEPVAKSSSAFLRLLLKSATRPPYRYGRAAAGSASLDSSAMSAEGGVAPASPTRPLQIKAFRDSVITRSVSAFGSWVQSVAAGWLVFQLTDSGVALGLVTVALRGSGVILPWVGARFSHPSQA